MPPLSIDRHIKTLIQLAVEEDLGAASRHPGDRTVELAIPRTLPGAARIVTRKPGVIAGTVLLPHILARYDRRLRARIVAPDGARVKAGAVVATLSGPVRALLTAERVVLNFLSHLSGIATLTRAYVDAVEPIARSRGIPAICDTRKTTPGFRSLDKYAVRCGGGVNHRIGLYDGVMLKDNHLAALREKQGQARSLPALIAKVRASLDPAITLWLEVDSLAQLEEALTPAGQGEGAPASSHANSLPDIILLDNFTPARMKQAVALRNRLLPGNKPRVLFEASGGITLANIAAVARTGVDRISIGAITHSAPTLDLSVDW